jgi:Putative prokaryotic signal transducing protein
MAYVDPDSLEEKDTALVYIAGKTSEAKAVESLFAQNEVTYTIKPTSFMRSSIFGGLIELPGVGFYVPAEQAASCRDLLRGRKFKVGLVLEGEE